MIAIDGSGGKDGAPASWAVIVLANDGHLQFRPYTAFAGLVLGPEQFQSVGAVGCNSTTAEGTALLGHCCGSLPILEEFLS